MEMIAAYIVDDGTLDTVVIVEFDVATHTMRYDSEYRFYFENDDAFLLEVIEEAKEEIERCTK